MTAPSTESNLLFGVLALQAGLLNAEQFAEGCAIWASRKTAPLADVLIERGWLSADQADSLHRLLDLKLKGHADDAHITLQAEARPDARAVLASIADPEIQRLLSTITRTGEASTAEYVAPALKRFTLIRLHAVGGIGQVWLARDNALGREVALKELRPDRKGSHTDRVRFLREAQVAGQLEHPHIVPVYEMGEGEAGGAPYYAMRFISGQTLRDAIRAYHAAKLKTAFQLRKLLTAFVDVCQAIGYAHSRGVIHRDLKPQNVVIGEFGEVFLLDWGLAKRLDEQQDRAEHDENSSALSPIADDVTRAGQVLGTPAYMAPEQASGAAGQVDARTDIYGLGAILYEALTGNAPYHGDTGPDLLACVLDGPPASARSINPSVPAALNAICAKAMARDKEVRYQKATDLADDVNRYLADEPVSVWREPWSARAARWGRHHRITVASVAALLVTAVVALGLSTVFIGRKQSETDRARGDAERLAGEYLKQQHLAEGHAAEADKQTIEANTQTGIAEARGEQLRAQLERARRGLFASELSQAAFLSVRDPQAALAILDDPDRCPPDLRDFTWRLLAESCRRDRFTMRIGITSASALGSIFRDDLPVHFVGPDLVLTVGRAGNRTVVRRYELSTGRQLDPLELPDAPILSRGRVQIGPNAAIPRFSAQPEGVAFDRACQQAALLTAEKSVRRWDLVAGHELPVAPLAGQQGLPAHFAFSEDLQRLATSDGDKVVKIWDMAGKLLQTLSGLDAPVSLLAFTPKGDRLIVWESVEKEANYQHTARAWDCSTGKPAATLPNVAEVPNTLVWSPDGRRLVAFEGRNAKLFDLELGKGWALKADELSAIHFLLGGDVLLGVARMHFWGWRIENGDLKSLGEIRMPGIGDSRRAVIAPDGKLAALITDKAADGGILWDPATAKPKAWPNPIMARLAPIAFTPDSKTLLMREGERYSGGRGPLRAWDPDSGRELQRLPGGDRVVLSPDGRWMAAQDNRHYTGMAQAGVVVSDVSNRPAALQRVERNEPVDALVYSPDGGALLVCGLEVLPRWTSPWAIVQVVDGTTGKPRATLSRQFGSDNRHAIALSADGRFAAAAASDRLVIWRADGTQHRSLPREPRRPAFGSGSTPQLEFLTGGSRLLDLAGMDLRLHDLQAGRVTATLAGKPSPITAFAAAPDGWTVAVGFLDGSLRLWNPETGAVRDASGKHEGAIHALRFHPSGKSFVSGGADRALMTWDAAGNNLGRHPGHEGTVLALAFSPDQGTLVSGGEDRALKFWDPQLMTVRASIQQHAMPVRALAFSPDGQTLASGSGNDATGELFLWQVGAKSGHDLAEPQRRGYGLLPFQTFALSPDGRTVAAADQRELFRWDARTGRPLPSTPLGAEENYNPNEWIVPVISGTAAQVGRNLRIVTSTYAPYLEYGPDRNLRITMMQNHRAGAPRLFTRDLATAAESEYPLGEPPADDRVGWSEYTDHLTVSADGRIAIRTRDNRNATGAVLVAWDPATGKEREVFRLPPSTWAERVSPDGRWLLCRGFGREGRLVLRHLPSSEEIEVPGSDSSARVHFTPDGRLVAWLSAESLTLFDLNLKKRVGGVADKQLANLDWSRDCQLSGDGKLFAISRSGFPRGDGVRVFDTATGEMKHKLALSANASELQLSGDILAARIQPSGTTRWEIVVWHFNTGKPAQTIRPRMSQAQKLAVSPDGRWLAIAGYVFGMPEGTVYRVEVWDLKDMKHVADVPHPGAVAELRFVSGGAVLATLAGDWRLFNTDTWKGYKLLRRDPSPPRYQRTTRAEFSANGRFVATLPDQSMSSLDLWDIASGAHLGTRPRSGNYSSGQFAFAPDGRSLMLVKADGRASTNHDLVAAERGGSSAVRFDGHPLGPAHALAVSPDGKLAASAGDDKVVRLWDPATGTEYAAFESNGSEVYALIFSPDGSLLAGGDAGGAVRLWEVKNRRAVRTLSRHRDAVLAIVFTRDGGRLISAGGDGELRLWDVATGGALPSPGAHRDAIQALRISADGKTVAALGVDQTIRVWELKAESKLAAQPPEAEAPAAFGVMMPDGAAVLRATPKGLDLIDVASGRVTPLPIVAKPVTALAVTPDGSVAALGGVDGSIELRKLPSGESLARWSAHELPVRALAFSGDGKSLASGAAAPTNLFRRAPTEPVKVWEVDKHQLLRSFPGPDGGVFAVEFTPSGRWLSAACDDGALLAWDWSSGRLMYRMRQSGPLAALAHGPDGVVLATGGLKLFYRDAQGGEFGLIEHLSPDAPGALVGAAEGRRVGTMTLSGSARSFAYSRDGLYLAVGQDNGEAAILAQFGVRAVAVASLRAHDGPCRVLGFTANDKALLTMGPDGEVKRWDTPLGTPSVTPIAAGVFMVEDAAGKRQAMLVRTDAGRELRVTEQPSGKELLRVGVPVKKGGRESVLQAFAPDGKQVALSIQELVIAPTKPVPPVIRRWDVDGKRELPALTDLADGVKVLEYSPDNRRLIVVGNSGSLKIWDVASGERKHNLTVSAHTIAFSPDAKLLLTLPQAGSGEVWELEPGKKLGAFPGQKFAVFAPDGRHVVAATAAPARLGLWALDRSGETPLFKVVPVADAVLAPTWAAFSADGRTLAVRADGKLHFFDANGWTLRGRNSPHFIASIPLFHRLAADRWGAYDYDRPDVVRWSCDGRSVLYPLSLGRELRAFIPTLSTRELGAPAFANRPAGEQVDGSPDVLALAADGKTLLTVGRNPKDLEQPGEVRLWTTVEKEDQLKPGPVLEGSEGLLRAVALSGDGKRAAVGGDACKVWVFNATDGKQLHAFDKHPAPITRLAFGPGGTLIASGDEQGNLKVWEAQTGKIHLAVRPHESAISALGWSADAKALATGGLDRLVTIWELNEGKRRLELRGQQGAITAVALNPDATRVAAAGTQMTVKLWDALTGRLLRTNWSLDYWPSSLVFSPDSGHLAAGSRAGTLIWRLDTHEIVGRDQGGFGSEGCGLAFDGKRWTDASARPIAGYYERGAIGRLDLRWGQPALVVPGP